MSAESGQKTTASAVQSGLGAGMVILLLLALFMGLLAWRVVGENQKISTQYDKINRSANTFVSEPEENSQPDIEPTN